MRLLGDTFPMRNRRAVEATQDAQMSKLSEEYGEVIEAFDSHKRMDYSATRYQLELGDELLDLMLTAEAMFCKLDGDVQDMCVRRVTMKGRDRGDWVE